jgi:hypothetical protein
LRVFHNWVHIEKEGAMKIAFARLIAISALVSCQAFAASEDEVRGAFEQFVVAQNAHDSAAVRELLLDSPSFLWITRGTPIWGREAALKRFEVLYQGAWKLAPDTSAMKVALLSDTTAQLYVPIMFTIGPPGQPPSDSPFLMNQTWVKTVNGWRIATILPIPVPPAVATSPK